MAPLFAQVETSMQMPGAVKNADSSRMLTWSEDHKLALAHVDLFSF